MVVAEVTSFIHNVTSLADQFQLWGCLRARASIKICGCNNIYTVIPRIFFLRLFSEVCLTCVRKSAQWEKMLPEGAERD